MKNCEVCIAIFVRKLVLFKMSVVEVIAKSVDETFDLYDQAIATSLANADSWNALEILACVVSRYSYYYLCFLHSKLATNFAFNALVLE